MDFPADRSGFYVSAAACLPVSASVFAGHACLNGADRAAGWVWRERRSPFVPARKDESASIPPQPQS